MVNRETILSRVKEYIPQFYNFILQCYGNSSILSFGNQFLLSQRGVQQGDPLGPPLFCLAIHHIVLNLKSELNLWYLDDGTIAGDPQKVFDDFDYLMSSCAEIGLQLNFKKCEFSILNEKSDSLIMSKYDYIIKQFSTVNVRNLTLLGCPFSDVEIQKTLESKSYMFSKLTKNMSLINSHSAYHLLKHSFSVPRIIYLLRSAPCWRSSTYLKKFDDLLRTSLQDITNCFIDSKAWSQCILPIKLGGLGIRDSSKLCFSAFLGTVQDSLYLLPSILPPNIYSHPDSIFDEALSIFKKITHISDTSVLKTQKDFDSALCKIFLDKKISSVESDIELARLLALQEPESNAWLNALPSSSLGTLLDDSSFRISVALRLGQPLCEPHTCTCGEKVDKYGLHGLSCKKSAGRWARHGLINDILRRGLSTANVPSILEPSGICRSDGKRVDGMSLVPWRSGRALLWDATCKDTLCKSYISRTRAKSGEAASLGESQKRAKYKELEDRGFLFVPFAVETFGPWGDEAKKLISEISVKTKIKHFKNFIIQRISVAIQRGNAASVLGTIPKVQDLDDHLNFL